MDSMLKVQIDSIQGEIERLKKKLDDLKADAYQWSDQTIQGKIDRMIGKYVLEWTIKPCDEDKGYANQWMSGGKSKGLAVDVRGSYGMAVFSPTRLLQHTQILIENICKRDNVYVEIGPNCDSAGAFAIRLRKGNSLSQSVDNSIPFAICKAALLFYGLEIPKYPTNEELAHGN